MPEELGAGAEEVGDHALYEALEPLPGRGRDDVPLLWRAVVQVVDAVQVQVLGVPARIGVPPVTSEVPYFGGALRCAVPATQRNCGPSVLLGGGRSTALLCV